MGARPEMWPRIEGSYEVVGMGRLDSESAGRWW
jgi:hypothetical protein